MPTLAERIEGMAATPAGASLPAGAEAVAALESELDRARAVVLRRGEGARTARYLAAKGFGDDAVAIAAGAGFASDP